MTQETANQPLPVPRPRRWGSVVVWIFVLGLLTLLGLGLVRRQQGPVGVGMQAPDFTLTTFSGEQIRLSDQSGKVVLVNFWASWCNLRDREAAALEQAYQLFKDRGVVFLG